MKRRLTDGVVVVVCLLLRHESPLQATFKYQFGRLSGANHLILG